MNYSRHRKMIEKTYDDRASISRYIEITKPSGETKLELTQIYSDLKCRVSQRALGVNHQTEAQNDISYETKLFISPDIEVLQGDNINVTRGALTRSYTAGEPFLYSTHQEVSLTRQERA